MPLILLVLKVLFGEIVHTLFSICFKTSKQIAPTCPEHKVALIHETSHHMAMK